MGLFRRKEKYKKIPEAAVVEEETPEELPDLEVPEENRDELIQLLKQMALHQQKAIEYFLYKLNELE